MKKFLKFTFKALKVILGVLLILYICAYAYVSVNKKSIINKVTDTIGKKLNGKVRVQDVELSFFKHFPKISVQLNNVSITDSMFKQHGHAFFQAERVFASISIMKLLKKQSPLNGLTIEKGGFYLYTDTSGYTNTYLFEKKAGNNNEKAGKEENELKNIRLKEVSFIIDDKKKEKLHNYFADDMSVQLDDRDEVSMLFEISADILIHSMAFSVPRGSFFKEKKFTGNFQLTFNKQLNQLQFDSIDIKLSGQPFNLSGRFDLKAALPQFSLRAYSRELVYAAARSLMTKRIDSSLSQVELDKPLNINVSINGPLKGGEPLIYVSWTAKGTQLKTPFLDFNNASFTGYFTNEYVKGLPRLDPNSIISIDNFVADWRGLPLTSRKIEILNLEVPILTCGLVAGFPLVKLNDVMGSNDLKLQSGDGAVDLTYKGPIERNNNTNSLINGKVSFKNGSILYTPRDVTMKDLSGELLFENSDISVRNLKCMVLNNSILMQGQAKNLLTLINTEPGKAVIDWAISTPSLSLTPFTFLLKPAKEVSSPSKVKSKLGSTASNIDAVLEKAILHVNLYASVLDYQKFQAGNVNADVTLFQNKYVINKVSMNHADGTINMNGSLFNLKPDYLQAKLNATMDNVDVSKVLTAFSNFGQDAIMAQNLNGKLTAKIDASVGLNENGKVYPSSAVSVVDFSLKNGSLVNFEPVKKLQNFLFKNRDFDNIRFAELKDRLEIANSDIKINRMEIQSSVFSFFIEGVYSMKGKTDLSIQVPLSNLKKRGADYNPENTGTDKKTKKSIYIRGRPGSDGNISFKLDLFNSYKRKNNIDSVEVE